MDLTKFFDENTAINKEGTVTASLSFARSFPIPQNLVEDEVKQWLDDNWGVKVYQDASETSHLLSLEERLPKITYKFNTEQYTQIDEWVEKISLKYPKLFFVLDPQWDGEHGDTWHDHGGDSYALNSDPVYIWKNGILYSDMVDVSEEYYLGILVPDWKPELSWVSFRQDLIKGVNRPKGEQSGRLVVEYFKPKFGADYLYGHHRTKFIIASYFMVLIDQTIHNYFRDHYSDYKRLASPVQVFENALSSELTNPAELLEIHRPHKHSAAELAFLEAIPAIEKQLKEFVRQHLTKLKPTEVWDKVSEHLPKKNPIFQT